MQQEQADPLTTLQQRISQKEHHNLQAFQKELLVELRTVRESLLAEAANTTAADQADPLGDAKDKRIAQLQNENRRLNYRILHLTRNLQTALESK